MNNENWHEIFESLSLFYKPQNERIVLQKGACYDNVLLDEKKTANYP